MGKQAQPNRDRAGAGKPRGVGLKKIKAGALTGGKPETIDGQFQFRIKKAELAEFKRLCRAHNESPGLFIRDFIRFLIDEHQFLRKFIAFLRDGHRSA